MSAPGEFRLNERSIRVALRLTAEFLLRNVEILSDVSEGDLMMGLVALAILQANVGPITDDIVLGKTFGSMDTIPPDEVRRPVSVNALSASLGVPYETMRRCVNRLIKLDYCVKVGRRGVIVPASVIASPMVVSNGLKQIGYLMQFLSKLKQFGVFAD